MGGKGTNDVTPNLGINFIPTCLVINRHYKNPRLPPLRPDRAVIYELPLRLAVLF